MLSPLANYQNWHQAPRIGSQKLVHGRKEIAIWPVEPGTWILDRGMHTPDTVISLPHLLWSHPEAARAKVSIVSNLPMTVETSGQILKLWESSDEKSSTWRRAVEKFSMGLHGSLWVSMGSHRHWHLAQRPPPMWYPEARATDGPGWPGEWETGSTKYHIPHAVVRPGLKR